MTSAMPPRWLSPAEQRAWRDFLWGGRVVMAGLDRDLRGAGVQASEYTHAASRLEERGWVLRQPCEEDRRGVLLTLTEDGLHTLVDLAPLHVDSVRRHLVDLLTPEEFARLGELMSVVRLAASVDSAGHTDGPATIDP